jgi:SAM-dependent methyltransferase
MPGHVRAAAGIGSEDRRVGAVIGDARALPIADDSADGVLLFGPMYHLVSRDDRLTALTEARRVLRPGGLVFVSAISRFASVFSGLSREFLFDERFRAIAERELEDGQHRNPSDDVRWFTTAYYHHPDELRSEAAEAQLEIVELVGIEGFAGWLPQLKDRWQDESGREAILFSARAIEAEACLLGLSPHLLLVGRRQT